MRLKVKQEELVHEAEELAGQIGDLESLMSDLYTCLEELRESWEGIAWNAHRNAAENLEKTGTECTRRLKTYPPAILKIAGTYRETEEENRQTAHSLKTEIIV